jgi:hypothetical protein
VKASPPVTVTAAELIDLLESGTALRLLDVRRSGQRAAQADANTCAMGRKESIGS